MDRRKWLALGIALFALLVGILVNVLSAPSTLMWRGKPARHWINQFRDVEKKREALTILYVGPEIVPVLIDGLQWRET